MSFIEKAELKNTEEDTRILREEINSSWVSTKVSNHLERNPYLKLSPEELKEKIMKDDLVASLFAEDLEETEY